MTRAAPRAAFAAAKINLFLHVGPASADGYHPIASLMLFADVGDRLSIGVARSGPPLTIEGPFADGLTDGPDNLVAKASQALAPGAQFAFALDKQLPLAAGLGGGSADAAAALRLINAMLPAPFAPQRLTEVARKLGADVAACLESVPVVATGRGDVLAAAPAMPPLDAVLVNPGARSSTADVYRAFDASGVRASADLPSMADRFSDAAAVVRLVGATRNDLEAPAVRLTPAIGEALAALDREPEALIARMSGSGTTVFALCADGAAATRLAARIAGARGRWWVRACRLGAAPS